MDFSPDKPITSQRQDKLGRTRFAKSLAAALGNWSDKESLVVALFGGWGTGKTSIKNLAVSSLQRWKAKKRPLVVEFNPWFVAGHEQLVELFYREIALAVAKPFPGENAANAEKRLKKLAAYLSVCGTAAHQALDVLSLFIPGAGLFAKLAKGAADIGETVEKSARAEKDISDASKKPQPQLKAGLREALSERETPILVVIDDIDRLTTEEICLLFRLIKANADFPRFIYLVLCDREFVTEALNNFAPNRGAEFLEKIVQVGFDVPPPVLGELMQIAFSEWETILKSSADASARRNKERWNQLLELSRPYLVHIRAIRRWMNAIRFAFNLFNSRNGFDANPEDVAAIELIRTFEPKLYNRLAAAKSELTYETFDFRGRERDKDKVKQSFFSVVPETRRSWAEGLVDWLFPGREWAASRSDDPELLRDLRVGNSTCFERYFQFTVRPNAFSRAEIKAIIEATSDYSQFIHVLSAEKGSARFEFLFEHLIAHRLEVVRHASIILQGLFDLGDELPKGEWVGGGEGSQYLAGELIRVLLSEVKGETKRSAILLSAITQAKGIMLPVFVIALESRDSVRKQGRLVSDEDLPGLQTAVVAKLRECQTSPRLTDAESVGFPLAVWKRWEPDPGPTAWVRMRLQDSSNVWQLLRSAAAIERSADEEKITDIDIQWLGKIIPLSEVDRALDVAKQVKLSKEQQMLVDFYDRAKSRAEPSPSTTS